MRRDIRPLAQPSEEPGAIEAATYARLRALYRAGYEPGSAGIAEMTTALGWTAVRRLDAIAARWPLSTVVLPDGTPTVAQRLVDGIDWGYPAATAIDGIIIAPRVNRLSWWRGA